MKKELEVAKRDMEDLLELADTAEERNLQNRTVASLYIRAMIRGNDFLCLKFLGETPSRHDNASEFFKKLYGNGHIEESLSRYRNNIADIVRKKSEMQYKSEKLSDRELQKIEKRVKRFVENVVRKHID